MLRNIPDVGRDGGTVETRTKTEEGRVTCVVCTRPGSRKRVCQRRPTLRVKTGSESRDNLQWGNLSQKKDW